MNFTQNSQVLYNTHAHIPQINGNDEYMCTLKCTFKHVFIYNVVCYSCFLFFSLIFFYCSFKFIDNWKPTNSGLPSTAGTTASIAFIRKGKLYIGHAGDSGIILGKEGSEPGANWVAEPLTVDHKPENPDERKRIEECGGKVIEKLGIHRVVWYRPRFPHQGPIRRNTRIEEIPFLAVARSLGDLWSYNWKTDKFMVSPEPDVAVYDIDATKHRYDI